MFKQIAVTVVALAAAVPMAAMAQQKSEGKVVRTNLTGCVPKATGGGCEGALTLETKADGKAERGQIKVVMTTLIRKGNDFIFLPATQGSNVVVTYSTDKGEKVASAIDVVAAK